MRRFLSRFLLVLCTLAPFSCAHAPEEHPITEAVLFEGMEFRVNSKEYRYSQVTVSGQSFRPRQSFLIMDLTIRNTYKNPVPQHFQPRFSLVDEDGREYEPSDELTALLNRNVKTVSSPADFSPETGYSRKLAFDVPEGNYRLRVFMPLFVKPGPNGAAYQGRFFYYGLQGKEKGSAPWYRKR